MATDDLVAAFRARKAKEAAQGGPMQGTPGAFDAAPPSSPSPAAPSPVASSPAAPSPTSSSPHSPASEPGPAPTPPPMTDATAPPWNQPSSVAVRPTAASLPAMRPAVEGGGVALSASSPALNLSDRLLADRFVSARGSRTGVLSGAGVALAGVVGYAAGHFRAISGLPSWWAAATLAVVLVGVALALLFLFVPRSRSLRVRLAATQQEEWARVQGEAHKLRGLSFAGGLLAAAGLTAAVAADALVAGEAAPYVVDGGLVMAVVGLAVLAWSAARRSLVQRLYVQTLVLSRLERTGLGPAAEPDPRVAPVLQSLDKLLGALPESAVRRFLASDEAAKYLELIDEMSGDRHGRP